MRRENITEREKGQILTMLKQGMSRGEIASKMNISYTTICNAIRRLTKGEEIDIQKAVIGKSEKNKSNTTKSVTEEELEKWKQEDWAKEVSKLHKAKQIDKRPVKRMYGGKRYLDCTNQFIGG